MWAFLFAQGKTCGASSADHLCDRSQEVGRHIGIYLSTFPELFSFSAFLSREAALNHKTIRDERERERSSERQAEKSCSRCLTCNMSRLGVASWSVEAAVSERLLSLPLLWWISLRVTPVNMVNLERKKCLSLIRRRWHQNLTFTADALYSLRYFCCQASL